VGTRREDRSLASKEPLFRALVCRDLIFIGTCGGSSFLSRAALVAACLSWCTDRVLVGQVDVDEECLLLPVLLGVNLKVDDDETVLLCRCHTIGMYGRVRRPN